MTTYYGAIHKSTMGYAGNAFGRVGEFETQSDAEAALSICFDDDINRANAISDGFPVDMALGACARNGRELVLATVENNELKIVAVLV